mmetsp:Transcript_6334/g.19631  ORF Transcript_6334/g.19631 Transcript_6334/m.19631 type:complete len:324 (+) Transcript_6334:385-1356(+)
MLRMARHRCSATAARSPAPRKASLQCLLTELVPPIHQPMPHQPARSRSAGSVWATISRHSSSSRGSTPTHERVDCRVALVASNRTEQTLLPPPRSCCCCCCCCCSVCGVLPAHGAGMRARGTAAAAAEPVFGILICTSPAKNETPPPSWPPPLPCPLPPLHVLRGIARVCPPAVCPPPPPPPLRAVPGVASSSRSCPGSGAPALARRSSSWWAALPPAAADPGIGHTELLASVRTSRYVLESRSSACRMRASSRRDDTRSRAACVRASLSAWSAALAAASAASPRGGEHPRETGATSVLVHFSATLAWSACSRSPSAPGAPAA